MNSKSVVGALLLCASITTPSFAETGDACVNRVLDFFEAIDDHISANGGEPDRADCIRMQGGNVGADISWTCEGTPGLIVMRFRIDGTKGARTCDLLTPITPRPNDCGLPELELPPVTGEEPLDSEKDFRQAKRDLMRLCRSVKP